MILVYHTQPKRNSSKLIFRLPCKPVKTTVFISFLFTAMISPNNLWETEKFCNIHTVFSFLCFCVCCDSHLSLLLRLQSSLFVERIRKWSMELLTERLLPLIAPSKPIPPRGFDLDGLSIPVPNWIPCHSHDIRSGDLPHKYVRYLIECSIFGKLSSNVLQSGP